MKQPVDRIDFGGLLVVFLMFFVWCCLLLFVSVFLIILCCCCELLMFDFQLTGLFFLSEDFFKHPFILKGAFNRSLSSLFFYLSIF